MATPLAGTPQTCRIEAARGLRRGDLMDPETPLPETIEEYATGRPGWYLDTYGNWRYDPEPVGFTPSLEPAPSLPNRPMRQRVRYHADGRRCVCGRCQRLTREPHYTLDEYQAIEMRREAEEMTERFRNIEPTWLPRGDEERWYGNDYTAPRATTGNGGDHPREEVRSSPTGLSERRVTGYGPWFGVDRGELPDNGPTS